MKSIKELCKDNLQNRIEQIKMCLQEAEDFIDENNFMQSAVRLQMVSDQTKFTEFELNLLDNISAKIVEAHE